MKHCPSCGKSLEYLGDDSMIGCGGISFYECVGCRVYFKEDQSGPFPHPENLEQVHPISEPALYSILSERDKKKDSGQ